MEEEGRESQGAERHDFKVEREREVREDEDPPVEGVEGQKGRKERGTGKDEVAKRKASSTSTSDLTSDQSIPRQFGRSSLGQTDRHCGPMVATRGFSQLLLCSAFSRVVSSDG
ncbi:uncharacterized protein KD926_007442 [Aspergillus affinis]|uniref:uncharacterized protein n=1 Tax=Aspergillus affinis TaxID=1070780 RepID=UPI0022FE605C|nr:uncharacterized protein KD926_007442 [Aspergillus affinis]KAI9041026.1 hypothetical protein KD926_007442 [Aspergillus affinis]